MIDQTYIHTDLPRLAKQGLYDPRFEHDACGVGLVASIEGLKSHDIVVKGIEVLTNLGHRGAAGADPDTGDGAGLLVQIPHKFFYREAAKTDIFLPEPGQYGIGTVFLPRPPDLRHKCEQIIEETVQTEGQNFLGWRDVPVSPSAIGCLAESIRPEIRQFFVGHVESEVNFPFELRLYIIRKQIENAVMSENIDGSKDFYICSLSSNKVVYKGLIMAHQLEDFYQDIRDKNFVSSFAMVHSRFSTNTLGEWKLAHPYRFVVHNGEINTLQGNMNWMVARQNMLQSPVFKGEIEKILPIVESPTQSDTATFDNVLELLLATGRSLQHSMMMMIPEAWAEHIPMDQKKKDFYEFQSCLMEPWDGPALMLGTDGTKVCAILDRNGLRPCRYLVTTDNLLVMASETGVLAIPDDEIKYKWRIQPGKMFLLDTDQGRLIEDDEIKTELTNRHPYGDWLNRNKIELDQLPGSNNVNDMDLTTILDRQKAFGYTLEDLRIIIGPMASKGSEPIGSMGNDTPLAVLSTQKPLLFNYFKQLFAQVSNPPLDAIREEIVTSVETFLGPEGNLFEELPEQCGQIKIYEPVLTNQELEKIKVVNKGKLRTKTVSTLYKPTSESLKDAMDRVCSNISEVVNNGYSIVILSDRGVDASHAPIPSLLAISGVHHHLIRQGSRTRVGLVVESGEPREVAHFALLFGYGASAVNPYLVYETLAHMVDTGDQLVGIDYKTAEKNFIKAIKKGIVKVMSKMGISTLQSYRGAQIFEAVGLNQEFIDQYFTWTPSRVSGIGIQEIDQESSSRHVAAYSISTSNVTTELQIGGYYQWRKGSEYHMWNPDTIAKLQHSVRSGSFETYKQFSDYANDYSARLCTIRGLLTFKNSGEPISVDEVEPASEIVKRFATGAASLGSISREAHEAMAIAMNRIGARSNTGEGGEDSSRYTRDGNGDSRSSAMKQVASGRFGVSSNYLTNATDLQIKMAQGSKPGEGGQLPGHKVDEYIGMVRNSTPGVELISPPPHHDIYSIEDLAQLIHDLKNSNPSARIHVKLVSKAGVGTIAAGVAKGYGDVVLISGDSGGTGASPESSIKTAGLPWEIGLAETQQVLVMNDLRGRIIVQTDGQIKTGRDVAIACLLGAEEFGFATAPLITMGCIMLRKCHLNTCSVGIATQDPILREQFAGSPEHLINYFFFVAEEFRQIMADVGFSNVNDMVGRVDFLDTSMAIDHWKAKGLDFSALLHKPDVPNEIAKHFVPEQKQDHGLLKALDNILIEKSIPALDNLQSVQIDIDISNRNRTLGAMLSHEISKRYGEEGLPEDTVKIKLKGSGGQSFAAFLARGVSMYLSGDANDYFCKGLSGGKVVVSPSNESTFIPEDNIIVGNVALYGATSGEVYIRGISGERFAVRNSGASAVVEGVGDHGCEYMTRGKVVVLGSTGRNFAAGMSGGEAYVFDKTGDFSFYCNTDMVDLEEVESTEDIAWLHQILVKHFEYTGSTNAESILADWNKMLKKFVKVMPVDYKGILSKAG